MMVKKKGMVVIGMSSQKNWDSMENPGNAWEIPGNMVNQGKHLKSWEIPGYFSSAYIKLGKSFIRIMSAKFSELSIISDV